MIQRVQTLYLLLITALMLALCFVPFASFITDAEEFKFTVWGIRSAFDTETGLIAKMPYMGILAILATALPAVTIFLFKYRLMQIRFCIMEMVLLFGMQVYIVMYLISTHKMTTETGGSISYSIVDVIPLICIILAYLAYRGIMKDEALVRSLNRIR